MPTPSEIFTRRLRDLRRAAGISQSELADLVSQELSYVIYTSGMTRLERGERAVRLDEAVAIAAALGVPLGELLTSRGDVSAQRQQLERDLQLAEWQASQAEAQVEEARAGADAIRRQIQELDDEQHAGASE